MLHLKCFLKDEEAGGEHHDVFPCLPLILALASFAQTSTLLHNYSQFVGFAVRKESKVSSVTEVAAECSKFEAVSCQHSELVSASRLLGSGLW